MVRFLVFLSVLFSLSGGMAVAQTASPGTLYARSWNYDWAYPGGFAFDKNLLPEGRQFKIQARFIWDGSGVVPYSSNEHAIVAFTQVLNSAGPVNHSSQSPNNQPLFGSGAGAFVSSAGLALELWHNNGHAIAWDHRSAYCANWIPASDDPTPPTNPMDPNTNPKDLCLANTYNMEQGFLTPFNNNSLQKGQEYWVRVTLTGLRGSYWTYLNADLVTHVNGILQVVQQGGIGFDSRSFFTSPSSLVQGTFAQALTSSNIQFIGFDGGF